MTYINHIAAPEVARRSQTAFTGGGQISQLGSVALLGEAAVAEFHTGFNFINRAPLYKVTVVKLQVVFFIFGAVFLIKNSA